MRLQTWAKASPSQRAIELIAIGLLATAALGFGIQNSGLASGYVDPLLHARAQDEAVYGHAAANMVRTGHWLTPVFLDRLMLNKPPLLFWVGALTMRLLGIGPMVLRLAPIAAGVLCCLLIYYWLRCSLPLTAALSGVFLLLSNVVFHAMARKFMTDILLAALVTAALLVLSRDPRLERWSTPTLFGMLTGAAVLTKSAAGLLPLFVLSIFLFLQRGTRPAASRVAIVVAAAVLVAGPWHLYQWMEHRDWFMAEYVRFQLIGSGFTAPSRYTTDSNIVFYLERLLQMDPVLLLLFCTGLPGLVSSWNMTDDESDARLLAAWSIAAFALLLIFGTRVAYYLLPLTPALVLLAVRFSPLFRGRWAIPMCAILTLVFLIKAVQPDMPFGLDYRSKTVASAPALENYSRLRRVNDLLIVSPDDEFYSSDLDLPKLRYVYLGTVDPTKTTMFFYSLGVNVSTTDFCRLDSLRPLYQQRLADWGNPNAGAIGTIVDAHSSSDLGDLIRCRPASDFFIPDPLRVAATEAGQSTHIAGQSSNGRFFLLANRSARRPVNAHASGTVITSSTSLPVTAQREVRARLP